jgi:catechol-2,3-dioxygenase
MAGDRRPLTGLHHISLTVQDLGRSVPWYRGTLDFDVVGEDEHQGGRTVVLADASGLTVLLQEHKAHEGSTFSEFRPGLDHLAFRVGDRRELERWRDRLEDLGVEHSGIRDDVYGSVLVFRDPDRIQLELFADPVGGPPA